MLNENKLNYLYKKTFDIIQTNPNLQDIEEVNILENNILNTKTKIYPQRDINRDSIPKQVPLELLDINKDDNNNSIIGSLIGKTSNDKTIKKYVKIQLNYVPNSKILDENNNIIGITFFSENMINSIPYNFDLEGTYIYEIYKPDGNTLVNIQEGNWYIDNESGLLVFNSNININIDKNNINYIDENNSPLVTFYSYNGKLGLYPLTYTKSDEVNIMSNLNINNNLIVKDNIISSGIFLNNNDFLPNINTLNTNHAIFSKSNDLYFGDGNSWLKILHQDSLPILTAENYVYNTDNTTLDNNKALSFINLTSNLTSNVVINLSSDIENNIDKTIVIGPSIFTYIKKFNIIITGIFMDINCNGPHKMNICFNKTGQFIKLISVKNEYNTYWQIIIDNSKAVHIIYNTENDLYINNFETIIYDNSKTNIIDVNTFITYIELNHTVNTNIYYILPQISTAGIRKLIVCGHSVNKYLDNSNIGEEDNFNNIIIYGIYGDTSGAGPIEMNIKFFNSGQSINIVSIVDDNNNYYWQILNGHYDCSDNFSLDENNILINDNVDPNIQTLASQINIDQHNTITSNQIYTDITLSSYIRQHNINSELFDTNIVRIQLSNDLEDDMYITLENYNYIGRELIIIMGETVNTYIKEFNIIITSKFLSPNPNSLDIFYYDIYFNSSGNYIQLISGVNKNTDLVLYKEKYWTLITGAFIDTNINLQIDTTLFTNYFTFIPYRYSELINSEIIVNDYNIFNQNDTTTSISCDDSAAYSVNHSSDTHNSNNNSSLNTNEYNILTSNKQVSIIELSQPLTNDLYFILPNSINAGFYKYIILGTSVSRYINNHNIIIYSKYITPEGTGPIFINVKMNLSGQSLYLVSLIKNDIDDHHNNHNNHSNNTTDNSESYINYYWQIINGQFHVDDNIVLSNHQYINHNNKEIYNQLVDPLYSFLFENIVTHSSLSITNNLTAPTITSTELTANTINTSEFISYNISSTNLTSSEFNSNDIFSDNITIQNSAIVKDFKNYNYISLSNNIYINNISTINNDYNSLIILKLNSNLVQDKILNLTTSNVIGLKKTIIFDDTISTYINNYIIKIKSYLLGSNTNNGINFNSNSISNISTINISKSGQVINLISMLSENNQNYWFVL